MKKIPIIGTIKDEKIVYKCQKCGASCKQVNLVKDKWWCFECFKKRFESGS